METVQNARYTKQGDERFAYPWCLEIVQISEQG